ncbi:MAG: DUF2255 family protein [Chitinophagaceae bacterium]
MNTTQSFSTAELKQIEIADDLKISPLRDDGVTYGTPTWIWNVVVDGQLYVRAYNGQQSRWYQSAIKQKAGRIHAAGMVKDVIFEPANEKNINEKVDTAYKEKYTESPYLPPMIIERARAATIRIILKH